MNPLAIHWGAIKDHLQQKYEGLTANDLAYVKDREDEILQRIAEKTGTSREELDHEVAAACANSTAAMPLPPAGETAPAAA